MLLAIAFLLAFCIFLNWFTAVFTVPELLKTLLGIETEFTRNTWALFNTTTFAALLALTYLCVDPILKAAYVLRCFYGESLQSGADIKADLKPFAATTLKTALILAVLLTMVSGPPARAGTINAPVPASLGAAVPSGDLDPAINQTIHQNKYLWRMPRETKPATTDADEGVISKFFTKAGEMVRDYLKSFFEWLGELLRKLFRHQPTPVGTSDPPDYAWVIALQVLLYGLVAAALSAVVILLYRMWYKRRRAPEVAASEPIQPVPDVADENVRADQLPEDGWTKLARELLDRGEFRLALRAFYLASLAHLAARNLVSIARFKSNRDYERELRRRAHSFPALLGVFGDNLAVFERIWYGTHAVDGGTVRDFAANVEKIKTGA
jgi:hypothetical protein